jgi:hypothetical protein
MPHKCFLVEKTGNVRKRKCACSDPSCTQEYDETEWRRIDTGETIFGNASEFGIGAMWFYDPNGYDWAEADKTAHLIVNTPGGSWDIDSRASNCTLPQDKVHRCWVRHGEPPNVTVDKNGVTCNAGAGSIIRGNYHGFLQNGYLT